MFKEGLAVHAASSFSAGFVTSALTAPVDLVRTRYMNFGVDGRPNYDGLLDCARKTWRTEGTIGLYKGFGAQWLRMGPHTMLQLIIWETLRDKFGVKAI